MKWSEVKRQLLENEETRKEYKKVDLSFEIGKMITDARIAKRMTQNALAKKVGTRQPSIARIESGNYLPSLSFLQKIAEAFDTELIPPKLAMFEQDKTTVVIVDFNFRPKYRRALKANYQHIESLGRPEYSGASTSIRSREYVYV